MKLENKIQSKEQCGFRILYGINAKAPEISVPRHKISRQDRETIPIRVPETTQVLPLSGGKVGIVKGKIE